MAEKLTPRGLVVGWIPTDAELAEQANAVEDAPAAPVEEHPEPVAAVPVKKSGGRRKAK